MYSCNSSAPAGEEGEKGSLLHSFEVFASVGS